MDVIALDDHVTEIDPDTECDALVLGNIGVARRHATLELDCRADRVDDTRELDQRAVAHQLDDAPVVFGNRAIDQLFSVRPEAREGAFLVRPDQSGITDHIRAQDRGKLRSTFSAMGTSQDPSDGY